PALTTSSRSPLTTIELWEARCGFPVPRPPVGYVPSMFSLPSASRRKATTSFFSASLVCRYTASKVKLLSISLCDPARRSPPAPRFVTRRASPGRSAGAEPFEHAASRRRAPDRPLLLVERQRLLRRLHGLDRLPRSLAHLCEASERLSLVVDLVGPLR